MGPDQGKLRVPGDLERRDAEDGGDEQGRAAEGVGVAQTREPVPQQGDELASAEHGGAGRGDGGGDCDAAEGVARKRPANHPYREHEGEERVGPSPVGIALVGYAVLPGCERLSAGVPDGAEKVDACGQIGKGGEAVEDGHAITRFARRPG